MRPRVTVHLNNLFVILAAAVCNLHCLRAKGPRLRLYASCLVCSLSRCRVRTMEPVVATASHEAGEISFGLDVEASDSRFRYGNGAGSSGKYLIRREHWRITDQLGWRVFPGISRHQDRLKIVVTTLVNDLHRLGAEGSRPRSNTRTPVLLLRWCFVRASLLVVARLTDDPRQISFGLNVQASDSGFGHGDDIGVSRGTGAQR